MGRQITVVVDTREQDPLVFKGQRIVRKKLDYGDYSLKGMEKRFVVERKSLTDLWSTLSVPYNFTRFQRELEGAAGHGIRLWVVVESTPSRVVMGTGYSLMNGFRLLDRLFEVCHRYGAAATFTGSPESASTVTLSMLRAGWEHYVIGDRQCHVEGSSRPRST